MSRGVQTFESDPCLERKHGGHGQSCPCIVCCGVFEAVRWMEDQGAADDVWHSIFDVDFY